MKKKVLCAVLSMSMVLGMSMTAGAQELTTLSDEVSQEEALADGILADDVEIEPVQFEEIEEIFAEDEENVSSEVEVSTDDEMLETAYQQITPTTDRNNANLLTASDKTYLLKTQEAANEKEYYCKFVVPTNIKNPWVRFTVTNINGEGRYDFYFEDEAGVSLQSATWCYKGESMYGCCMVTPGHTYYFRMHDVNRKGGNLGISLKFLADPEGSKITEAVTLTEGNLYKGSYVGGNKNDDYDYFKFTTKKAGHYQIDFDFLTGEGNTDIWLKDVAEKEIFKDSYLGIKSHHYYAMLDANSDYYIVVKSHKDGTYNVTYKYNADEESDSIDSAFEIKDGAAARETSLCAPKDVDWYKFTATHDCEYTVTTVKLTGSAYLETRIYDSNKMALSYQTTYNAGSTTAQKLSAKKGNLYYIKVSGKDACKYSIKAGPTMAFNDVSNSAWYYEAVAYVAQNKIMSGTSDGVFSPKMNCTRAQMVQILYNAENRPYGNNISFEDVKYSDWFYYAVRWAVRVKVTSGVTSTMFAPNNDVTRQEMAMFLMNYAKSKGFSTNERVDLGRFSDNASISGWAREAMSWANAKKIINGTGSGLNPRGTATRAEVAQMIMNFQKQFK